MRDGTGRLTYVIPFVIVAILIHVGLVIPILELIIQMQSNNKYSDSLSIDLWTGVSSTNIPKEEKKTAKEELEDYKPEANEIPDKESVRNKPTDPRKPLKKPKFLSESDNRVDRETVSRRRSPESGDSKSNAAQKALGTQLRTVEDRMKAETHGVGPVSSQRNRADDGDLAALMKAAPGIKDISIKPSMQAMAAALLGTGLDRLDDVIEADNTQLNTAGWEYASFFNGIKRKVEQRWHPGYEFRRNDPYGKVYGFKDRVTVLLVVLHSDGKLKKLYVMEPSGIPFLDDEAYNAVRDSAPFPNVPKGLMDKRDGLVKFTFHFIVEVGSQPVFRVRRYHS